VRVAKKASTQNRSAYDGEGAAVFRPI